MKFGSSAHSNNATEVEYDASVRVAKTWAPHGKSYTACEEVGTGSRAHRPQTRRATSRTYDILGRLTGITHPDNSTKAIAYDGLDTTFTDAKGYATKESRNALGELAAVERRTRTHTQVSSPNRHQPEITCGVEATVMTAVSEAHRAAGRFGVGFESGRPWPEGAGVGVGVRRVVVARGGRRP